MLSEGKIGKYLTYAIGEIVLVVIGILIAIQINDWNNNRIEKNSDYQLIEALITDLRAKNAELLGDLEYGKSLINSAEKIFENWGENKKIDTSNLKSSIVSLGDDRAFFNEKSPILEGISNSNLWKRLPEHLLKQIDDVFRNDLTAVKSSFDKLVEYATHCKFYFLIPNGLTDTNLETEEIQSIINDNSVAYISYLEVYADGMRLLNTRFANASKGINKLIDNLTIYQSEINK